MTWLTRLWDENRSAVIVGSAVIVAASILAVVPYVLGAAERRQDQACDEYIQAARNVAERSALRDLDNGGHYEPARWFQSTLERPSFHDGGKAFTRPTGCNFTP